MPYKTGKMKGLLTLAELKKLVVNHNKLSKISMPSAVKRDALIKLMMKTLLSGQILYLIFMN